MLILTNTWENEMFQQSFQELLIFMERHFKFEFFNTLRNKLIGFLM